MSVRAKLLIPFQVLVVLVLPALLMVGNLLWAAGEVNLYEYGFRKYEVDQATGIEQAELAKAAAVLVRYFDSAEEPVDVRVMKDGREFELFNEREKVHLRDVKELIQMGRRLRLGLLAYALLFVVLARWWAGRDSGRTLARAGLFGAGLALALIFAFGLVTLVGFDWLFLQFHLLSFSNEFWMLDPATDYLIRMVPQGFFYDATLFVTLATLVEAVLLGGVCRGYLRRSSRQTGPVV
ncbi:MAG: TIGR01906 family membrane protein [Dehalococcoidia bacterium]|nr:TIGR01906 family membrane protein [Dehalococcoidia bacterium]